MKRFRGSSWPILLLPLLGILAWLQYRWTGQLSVAEQERMQASLQSSVRRFTGDVDQELALFFQLFRIARDDDLESTISQRLAQYQEQAAYPELLDGIYVAHLEQGLSKLDSSGELVSTEWPKSFERFREQMVDAPRRGRRGGGPPFQPLFISAGVPVLSMPLASRDAGWPGFSFSGYTLATVDVAELSETLLPELAERHFGPDYDVAVVDAAGELVFVTPQGELAAQSFDARGALFALSPFGGRPSRRGERRRPPPELAAERERRAPRGWSVFVRHRSGSLETAVASARTRNLVVSFGILGLLGASIALVVVSTRRATELNDRKMEFVAGVSHELRTPVAVIRSAGQNLADRSVSEPAQVVRYGALIESEGRRLNDLVEQVLELAGIQSQKRRYRREPIAAEELVGDALRDCETLREERGVSITTKFLAEGAVILGDRDALRRALGNIITNAVKHGGDGNVIEVTVEARGPNAAIVVTDHGPGIPGSERAHLFEAFFRGRRAHDRQVQGSGLGLSLVDHVAREHAGSVEVESTPGEGSRFTLILPATSAE